MADIFFEVHRSALNEAIATVFPAVDTRSKIQILECILIECDGEALHLRASNLDLQIDASCELLAAHEKCTFALPAARLKAFVAAIADNAEIAFLPGKFQNQVKMQAGNSTVSLSHQDVAGFPSLDPAAARIVDVDGPALARAMGSSAFAVSRADDRPYLTGICLHQMQLEGKDCLTVAATDGLVGARLRCHGVNLPGLPAEYGMHHVIIPPAFAKETVKLFGKSKAGWRMGASDTLIVAETPAARIISKLIDGHYPEYDRIFPPQGECLEIETEALRAAIRRVAIVAEDDKKEAVLLRIANHKATLLSYNLATGGAREALPAETAIEQAEIGFNAGQMLSVLEEISARTVRVTIPQEAIATLRIDPLGSDDMFLVRSMKPRAMPEAF